MHPYRGHIVPPAGKPDDGGTNRSSTAEVGAGVRFVRDGPVPEASCPHCGGRLELSAIGSRWHVRHPGDIADRLVLQLGTLEREELHTLVLDTKCGVIAQERVYVGNVRRLWCASASSSRPPCDATPLASCSCTATHRRPDAEPRRPASDRRGDRRWPSPRYRGPRPHHRGRVFVRQPPGARRRVREPRDPPCRRGVGRTAVAQPVARPLQERRPEAHSPRRDCQGGLGGRQAPCANQEATRRWPGGCQSSPPRTSARAGCPRSGARWSTPRARAPRRVRRS